MKMNLVDSKIQENDTTKIYEPFGEEWANEIMKLSKSQLIVLLKNASIEADSLRNYLNRFLEQGHIISIIDSGTVIGDKND